MRFPYIILAIVTAVLGYRIGQHVGRIRTRAEADAIHNSIARFISESERLRTAVSAKQSPQSKPETIRQSTDMAAKSSDAASLPIKPGDVDKALADGSLAFYKPRDGTS